jgi:bis(5'-nucleosyl)-tetraphosphatase (symmetrical)
MVTYAIGDIQGCERTLQRLLAHLRLDESADELWLVGDLVNRGPRSLAVLRWARAQADRMGARFACVLGNHELHLLAHAAGLEKPRKGDTLDEVLAAPDRDELLDWLRHRPLLHRRGPHVLVHAGLHPQWSIPRAVELADEVHHALAAPDGGRAALAAITEGRSRDWKETLSGGRRLASIAAVLTRLRTCRPDGRACFDFKGAPADAPPRCMPWFTVPQRASADHTVVFGHWAALGLHVGDGVIGLDTACVWGKSLTAVRLEDGALFHERCIDEVQR